MIIVEDAIELHVAILAAHYDEGFLPFCLQCTWLTERKVPAKQNTDITEQEMLSLCLFEDYINHTWNAFSRMKA